MAPVSQGSEAPARARAELLFQLCGKNTMVAPERLIRGELTQAAGRAQEAPVAYSIDGMWYPEGADDLPAPASTEELLHGLVASAPNRAERRRLSKAVKRNPSRAVEQVQRTAREGHFASEEARERLAGYPLKPEDLHALLMYFSGQRSDDAAAIYRRSLSDPGWILEWIYSDTERSREFAQTWLRAPGQRLADQLRTSIDQADAIRASGDPLVVAETLSDTAWGVRTRDGMTAIAHNLAKQIDGWDISINPTAIQSSCPGLYSMLGTFYSAWKGSAERNRKAPLSSDFGDVLHALYAPYVDVFRTDSSMAPHVAKHLPAGSHVVRTLRQLLPSIEQLLTAYQLRGSNFRIVAFTASLTSKPLPYFAANSAQRASNGSIPWP